MKNPFMSAWLSEANKIANAGKGQMMAEMSRQQQAMTKAWVDQMVEMQQAWLAMMFPWMPRK